MSTSDPIRGTVVLPQPVRNSTRLPSAIPQIKDDVIARFPSLRGFNDELKTWWTKARFAIQTDYEELADGSNTAINSNDALASAFRTEISERKEGDVTVVQQIQELIIQQGGPNRIFVRTTPPPAPLTGDLWFDSDDDFRPWFYDGAGWVDARDRTISGSIAAISSEQTVRISEDLALSQRIDATLNRIDDPDTGLVGLSNSIELVETSVSTQGDTMTAHGQRLDQIDSDITAQDGTISGHTTAIGNIQTDVTAKGGLITAQGLKIAGLESSVNTAGTGLLARVGTIETTYATDLDVAATRTDSISAAKTYTDQTVGTLSSSITTNYATKVYADNSSSAAKTEAIASANGHTDGAIAGITTNYATKVYADGAAGAAYTQAVSAAAAYTNTSKSKTFAQAGAPVASAVGDLWINTSDGNNLFRWDGGTWAAAADTKIGTALNTANSKVKTFVQSATPAAVTVGDLWIDTTAGANLLRRWDGGSWINVDVASGRIGSVNARVTVESEASATRDGNLAGKYTIRVDAGGRAAGMNISAVDGPGSNTNEISFLTDSFKVWNGSTSEAPFEVVGGATRIKCLVAGNVSTTSTRFHPEDKSRTLPTVSHANRASMTQAVGANSVGFITATNEDLTFIGWKRGGAGYSGKRFGSANLRLEMYVAVYITNTGRAGEWCQVGPCWRTRSNGGGWGGWMTPGWDDHYLDGKDAPSVTVALPENQDGVLNGDMDIQIGCRIMNYGAVSITPTCRVWGRVYNG